MDMQQVPSAQQHRPSPGANKAIAAMGGGILAAGLGASFPVALILGCTVGYVLGHFAEKNEKNHQRR